MLGKSVVVCLTLVSVGACGGSDGPSEASGRFASVFDGVCLAAAKAQAGDTAGAKEVIDDVHGGLHDLAGAAGRDDREAAASLLRAKQRVEAQRDSPTAAELARLSGAVRDAIRSVGDAAPDDCA